MLSTSQVILLYTDNVRAARNTSMAAFSYLGAGLAGHGSTRAPGTMQDGIHGDWRVTDSLPDSLLRGESPARCLLCFQKLATKPERLQFLLHVQLTLSPHACLAANWPYLQSKAPCLYHEWRMQLQPTYARVVTQLTASGPL